MGILEVVLLIAGIVIFIGSFLLPSGKESGINKEAAKEEIKGLMEEEMQTVRSQMQDKMDETSEDALEKAERSLERLTNEKIMAVNIPIRYCRKFTRTMRKPCFYTIC